MEHPIYSIPTRAANSPALSTAVCDGTTDDSAAIQTMVDSYTATFIPPDGASQTQINLGTTGITLHHSGDTIYMNGQIFAYEGTGSAVTLALRIADLQPSTPLDPQRDRSRLELLRTLEQLFVASRPDVPVQSDLPRTIGQFG